MKQSRKLARQRLKQSTRAEFERLIYAAKLTPRQEQIINHHIENLIDAAQTEQERQFLSEWLRRVKNNQ